LIFYVPSAGIVLYYVLFAPPCLTLLIQCRRKVLCCHLASQMSLRYRPTPSIPEKRYFNYFSLICLYIVYAQRSLLTLVFTVTDIIL